MESNESASEEYDKAAEDGGDPVIEENAQDAGHGFFESQQPVEESSGNRCEQLGVPFAKVGVEDAGSPVPVDVDRLVESRGENIQEMSYFPVHSRKMSQACANADASPKTSRMASHRLNETSPALSFNHAPSAASADAPNKLYVGNQEMVAAAESLASLGGQLQSAGVDSALTVPLREKGESRHSRRVSEMSHAAENSPKASRRASRRRSSRSRVSSHRNRTTAADKESSPPRDSVSISGNIAAADQSTVQDQGGETSVDVEQSEAIYKQGSQSLFGDGAVQITNTDSRAAVDICNKLTSAGRRSWTRAPETIADSCEKLGTAGDTENGLATQSGIPSDKQTGDWASQCTLYRDRKSSSGKAWEEENIDIAQEEPQETKSGVCTFWKDTRSNSGNAWVDQTVQCVQQAPQTLQSEPDLMPGQIEDDDDDRESKSSQRVDLSKAAQSLQENTTAEDRQRGSVVVRCSQASEAIYKQETQAESYRATQNDSQKPAHPTVRVVVTADTEEKESRGYPNRPTFFQSMLKDGEVDFGLNTSRLDKIRVVSFSGGRVFDALHLEENSILARDKRIYVPFDQLKAFIRALVEDMEKMKRQSIDAITEMEWNFRILDQKTKKRCETQVATVKSRALEKLEIMRKKLLEYKLQMEFYEAHYNKLKECFETRVRQFKEQMPKDLQELDARWETKVSKVQKALQTTQIALEDSQKIQNEVGTKINKLIEELTKVDIDFHHSEEVRLVDKMNKLHVVVKKVVDDNTKEQVALVLRQLVDRVEAEDQEKKIVALEKENGVLKDACGDGLQRRIAEYEKEIADLNAACRAAEAGAASGGVASYGDVEKLRNELTVLNAENMILRRKLAGGDVGAVGPFDSASAAHDGEAGGSGAGADPVLIQQLTLTVEDLERQIKSLKEENEQLQAQVIMSEEHATKGGKGGGKPGEGPGARLVQQLQQKNKMLESQVEPMRKKIRELEVVSKRGGGAEADQRVRELELKLKDVEAEARKQQRQIELDLSKNSKGAGMEVRKLENQVQKLTERATNAETSLEAADKELKDTKKERDGLRKEADDLRQQMGQAQQIISEVQTLRVQTKEQTSRLIELEESYKQEKSLRKKYYNEIEDMKGKIRVYCRIRPMAKYELEKNCKQSVHPVDEYTVKVQTNKGDKEFMFDRTFPPDITQEAVYEDTQRLIQSVIDGFNVCIFAYGQTGSGKTFTIQGNNNFPGIAPRAIKDLFETLESYDKNKFTYSVEVYMCELYNNQLVDLLLPDDKKKAPPPLDIKKDVSGMVTIPGVTLRKVDDRAALYKIFAYGLEARHVSGTAMNAESSRSHLIFSVIVKLEDKVAGKRANGKLSLIDLAGSERVSKSGATNERLVEAREINKSLSALGDVIAALSSGESFIPYRNHKLTQLMSDSLGGTAKTLMFVNVSPADYNTDETVTSLMYASRVKLITNDATKHVESKQLANMKDTIKILNLIIEKLKKGDDVSEFEKQLTARKGAAAQEEERPPADEPNDEQDYEEPPDLPAK